MSQHPVIELYLWFREFSKLLTYDNIVDLILHAPQYYASWWNKLFHETPEHVFIETTLILFILWLLFIRKTVDPKKSSKAPKLTEKEINWLIESWQPEPLVPDLSSTKAMLLNASPMIDAVNGLELKVRGISKPVLNVSSYDFLGLGMQQSIKDVSYQALEKYGCGSCGPRGFYGTIDQHIFFEQALSSFMGTQETILYSDGSTAVSSTIPAFSKKGDLLIVDEACSEPILTGCNLSRSTVHFFKHNDMAELASILRSIAKEDKRLRVDTSQQRRFIVVEGVYRNTGSICNLPELLRLGKEFFYRLIIDESISFGTMGRTGRGLTEHFGISIYDIDIIVMSLDTTLASIGGVCIGTREIVDHQRLSGAGYCFSASAPPFLSAAAVQSLRLMESNPQYLTTLHENSAKCIEVLKGLESLGLRLLANNQGYPSPIIHLVFANPPTSRDAENEMIVDLYNECLQQGVGVSINRSAMLLKKATWPPSIRLCGSAAWTDQDIKRIGQGITNALKATLKKYAK